MLRDKWSLPVMIPISSLLVLALAVSPYHSSSGRGSYGEAWPNLAAAWILMALFLISLWLLTAKAGPLLPESRLPAFAILALAAASGLMGLIGLSLSMHVTGFPWEYQHMMLWFSLSTGLFLGGLGILLSDSLKSTNWGSFAYFASLSLGAVTVVVAIGLSILLLFVFTDAGLA